MSLMQTVNDKCFCCCGFAGDHSGAAVTLKAKQRPLVSEPENNKPIRSSSNAADLLAPAEVFI